ncbi:hypothetical protein E2562_027296 [Oryza meyeriana var. granulata]|uniref:Exocyst complex subunit Exo70 C-terminal domain-containing protein n=1 Tax=Oryza meyeriana var. granulata TaxID=110450 RepID=A0A6G1C058_9ORYZ|nr:hypothetical protein E2562_027296 [Oryza meyeriana var. granulata]
MDNKDVYKLSIGAACALMWPPDRIIIQVLDDSTDPAIKVLQCISGQGLTSSGGSGQVGSEGGNSSGASRAAVKERFRSFNVLFEEIYEKQCGWSVPDMELRDGSNKEETNNSPGMSGAEEGNKLLLWQCGGMASRGREAGRGEPLRDGGEGRGDPGEGRGAMGYIIPARCTRWQLELRDAVEHGRRWRRRRQMELDDAPPSPATRSQSDRHLLLLEGLAARLGGLLPAVFVGRRLLGGLDRLMAVHISDELGAVRPWWRRR